MTEKTELLDHGAGALYGLAIGDALGMPTQMLSPIEVRQTFGRLNWFESAPVDHPIAAGMPAGSITDDTEQALLLAKALIEGKGRIDQVAFARSLLDWENRMRERGSLDLLGPSTKAAVTAISEGTPPQESGNFGATNGAAMRVAPVGLIARSNDLDTLVDLVVEASAITHNTSIALAGASAVAAAIAGGLDGASANEAIRLGIQASKLAANRGNWVAGGEVAARIELAIEIADPTNPEESAKDLNRVIGTSLATQESVPMAFGLVALYPNDAFAACLGAAVAGGDSDTIAAMAGAILGSVHGLPKFPKRAIETIRDVNGLDLEQTARELIQLRG